MSWWTTAHRSPAAMPANVPPQTRALTADAYKDLQEEHVLRMSMSAPRATSFATTGEPVKTYTAVTGQSFSLIMR